MFDYQRVDDFCMTLQKRKKHLLTYCSFFHHFGGLILFFFPHIEMATFLGPRQRSHGALRSKPSNPWHGPKSHPKSVRGRAPASTSERRWNSPVAIHITSYYIRIYIYKYVYIYIYVLNIYPSGADVRPKFHWGFSYVVICPVYISDCFRVCLGLV